jgi:hypothetical protein
LGNDVDDLWRRLIDHWRGRGVAIRPGVDAAGVARFEAAYGVRLPDDLRDYFAAVNGTGTNLDDDLFRFWSLEEVRPVQQESRDARLSCFDFADYCIDTWRYAVELPREGAGTGAVFNTGRGPPFQQVSPSFREFFELYLGDPDSLL